MSNLVKHFINSCTLTFKAFEHEVIISKNQSAMWNFMALNKRRDKVYAVYCAPQLSSAKSLIKVVLKKVPKDTRLVVVTATFTDTEQEAADKDGFSLVTLDILSKYRMEMLEIKQREEADSLSNVA